jgi:hypothetical protein
VLIVGDGCTDETADVVATFADPRLRWFDLPKGPHFGYANRNRALRQARGAFVAYMAHDDLWFCDHLARLGALLAAPRIEWAYSRTLWVAPDGLITPAAFNLHDAATRRAFIAMEANNISATCVAHRRDCLERYGYWDESLPRNGDWELWGRIIRGGGERNFAHEPTPTCLHFRAIWKTETSLGPPELYQWRDLRAHGTLPADRPTVPTAPGEPEQATAWRALAADPDGEVARIRREVVLALDLVAARTDLLLTVPYLAGVIAQLPGEIGARDGEIAAASRHIAGLERLIGDKDRHSANLEGFIRERDARIVQHEATVATQAQQLVSLEEGRALLGQQLADLQTEVASAEQRRLGLERELAEVRRILADRERHIARFEGRWPLRLYRRLRRLGR